MNRIYCFMSLLWVLSCCISPLFATPNQRSLATISLIESNTVTSHNIVANKNREKVILDNSEKILTQRMFSKPNSIYVFLYDFDLKNNDITIPDNCVLQFEGGSISNGSVNLNDCYIESAPVQIFSNVHITGIYSRPIYGDWFENLNECIDCVMVDSPTFLLSDRDYWISKPLIIHSNTSIIGLKKTDLNYQHGSFIKATSSFDDRKGNAVILFKNIDDSNTKNVILKDFSIWGNSSNLSSPSINGIDFGNHSWGIDAENIFVYSVKSAFVLRVIWSSSFKHCKASRILENGFQISNKSGCTSLSFENCVVFGGKNGINAENSLSASFNNCAFDGCETAINIQGSGNSLFSNISIENFTHHAILINGSHFIGVFNNVSLVQGKGYQAKDHVVDIENCENVSFIGCYFTELVKPIGGKLIINIDKKTERVFFIGGSINKQYSNINNCYFLGYDSSGTVFQINGVKRFCFEPVHISYDDYIYKHTKSITSTSIKLTSGDYNYMRGTPAFYYSGNIGDVIEFFNFNKGVNIVFYNDTEEAPTGLILGKDIIVPPFNSIKLLYIGDNKFRLYKSVN